jgi:CIC family chloride channel protein
MGATESPDTRVLLRALAPSGLAAGRGPAALLGALRMSNPGLLVLSLLVGAGAGGGAVAFRWLIATSGVARAG